MTIHFLSSSQRFYMQLFHNLLSDPRNCRTDTDRSSRRNSSTERGWIGSNLLSRKTAQEQWASPSAGNLEEENRLHATCLSASPTSGQRFRARVSFPGITLLEAVLESLTCMVLPHVIPSQVPFSNRIKEHNLNCTSLFPAPTQNVYGPEDEVQQMVS